LFEDDVHASNHFCQEKGFACNVEDTVLFLKLKNARDSRVLFLDRDGRIGMPVVVGVHAVLDGLQEWHVDGLCKMKSQPL
jgi:hypothetical protein